MQPLPPETLPAVPFVSIWIFNIAIPNLIMVGLVIIIFIVAAWRRIPKIF